MKGHQWRVVYYLILIDAGLVALTGILKIDQVTRILLVFLALAANIAGLWFLCDCQKNMTKYRERIRRARQKLTPAGRKILHGEEYGKEDKDPIRWTHASGITWILLATVFFAFGLTVVAICFR